MANSNVDWSSFPAQLLQMGYQLHPTGAAPGSTGATGPALHGPHSSATSTSALAPATAPAPAFDDNEAREPLTLLYGPRPDGTPGRGKFQLQEVLGLSNFEYNLVKRIIKTIAIQCRLQMTKYLCSQNSVRVRACCARALVALPEFRDFDDPEWPIIALLYVILKGGVDSERRAKANAAKAKKAKERSESRQAHAGTAPAAPIEAATQVAETAVETTSTKATTVGATTAAATIAKAAAEATDTKTTTGATAAKAAAVKAAAVKAAAVKAAAIKATAAKAAAAKAAAEAAAAEAAAAEAAAEAIAAEVPDLPDLSMLSLCDDDDDNGTMDLDKSFSLQMSLDEPQNETTQDTSGAACASTSTTTRSPASTHDSLAAFARTPASFLDRLPASLLNLTTGVAPALTSTADQTRKASNKRVAHAMSPVTPATIVDQFGPTQPKPKARPKMRKVPEVDPEPESTEHESELSASELNPPVESESECNPDEVMTETVETAGAAESTQAAGRVGRGGRGSGRGGRGGQAKQQAPVETATKAPEGSGGKGVRGGKGGQGGKGGKAKQQDGAPSARGKVGKAKTK